jgi:hypothetical protein
MRKFLAVAMEKTYLICIPSWDGAARQFPQIATGPENKTVWGDIVPTLSTKSPDDVAVGEKG